MNCWIAVDGKLLSMNCKMKRRWSQIQDFNTPLVIRRPTFYMTKPSKATLSNLIYHWNYSNLFSGMLVSYPVSKSTSGNIVSETSSSNIMGESSLLIVGPGVLGKLVAEKWQQDYPGCHIFGQTMTTEHHDDLVKLGIKPSLSGRSDREYPNIIFCAPPSRTTDYPGDVRVALSNWNGEGSFLFTSSTAVYDCNDEQLCDEDYPVVPIGRSPRTDVLLKAESAVLEAGGCVLRLAGLYSADRGAHVYYLKKGVVDVHPDGILNLIHYEDAASLAIAIMKRKLRGRIFLGCDNNPISRKEIMDCVNRSRKYSGKFQGFTGNTDKPGKKMNNSKTRAEIGWEPKYSSLSHFLDQLS